MLLDPLVQSVVVKPSELRPSIKQSAGKLSSVQFAIAKSLSPSDKDLLKLKNSYAAHFSIVLFVIKMVEEQFIASALLTVIPSKAT